MSGVTFGIPRIERPPALGATILRQAVQIMPAVAAEHRGDGWSRGHVVANYNGCGATPHINHASK